MVCNQCQLTCLSVSDSLSHPQVWTRMFTHEETWEGGGVGNLNGIWSWGMTRLCCLTSMLGIYMGTAHTVNTQLGWFTIPILCLHVFACCFFRMFLHVRCCISMCACFLSRFLFRRDPFMWTIITESGIITVSHHNICSTVKSTVQIWNSHSANSMLKYMYTKLESLELHVYIALNINRRLNRGLLQPVKFNLQMTLCLCKSVHGSQLEVFLYSVFEDLAQNRM